MKFQRAVAVIVLTLCFGLADQLKAQGAEAPVSITLDTAPYDPRNPASIPNVHITNPAGNPPVMAFQILLMNQAGDQRTWMNYYDVGPVMGSGESGSWTIVVGGAHDAGVFTQLSWGVVFSNGDTQGDPLDTSNDAAFKDKTVGRSERLALYMKELVLLRDEVLGTGSIHITTDARFGNYFANITLIGPLTSAIKARIAETDIAETLAFQ